MPPSIRPELKRAIARTVAAIALGVVATPITALVPLVELGTEKDADCAAIVSQASAVIEGQPGAQHRTCSHQFQSDAERPTMEVCAHFDRGRMLAVFLECAVACSGLPPSPEPFWP